MVNIEHIALGRKSQVERVALSIYKKGKNRIVCKVTTFSDSAEPILAIAVKNQVGTSEMFSLPMSAINFAVRCGVRWVYHRYDRAPFVMRRVLLQTLKERGFLQRDGEIYFALARMEPVPWRPWRYAERILELDNEAETKAEVNAPKQLALAFEGCASG
jgi:hypothetical protein